MADSPTGSRPKESLRIRRLAARFVGGGYIAYFLVCLPEIRADAVIVASWWTPLAVVLSFLPGWLLFVVSFNSYDGWSSQVLPLLCAGGYLLAAGLWFVAWNGGHVAGERGSWLVMYPGVVSMALVPSRRPWWAVSYLAICTPLVLVVSALGRSDRYPHLPGLGDVAWAVVFSASFVLAGIAAVRTGDLLDAAREEAARIAAEAAAQEAREAERELHKLLVHDRVLVVLQEVEAGVNAHLVPYARKALTDMEIAEPDVDSPAADLVSRLRRVVREMGSNLPVVVHVAVAPCAISDEVADALVEAAGEAIRNALRHAGTAAVITISADWRVDAVEVAVADTGPGFDSQAVAPDRMGVRMSIGRRIAAVGGLATIETAPGRGTRVLLQWPG